MKEKVAERVKSNELARMVLSIPGIGIAAALPAYLGDGRRFSSAGQASSYAGFTLRVDCSWETEWYGGIARYQFCHPIRRWCWKGYGRW
jgi:transposase